MESLDWDVIAPMVVSITLILSVAAIFILRPVTKRLGDLIEITAKNRQAQGDIGGGGHDELARLSDTVGLLADRLDQLEERQDFAERVLTHAKREERAQIRGEGER